MTKLFAFEAYRIVFITFHLHHVWKSPNTCFCTQNLKSVIMFMFLFLAPQQTVFTTIPIIFFLCGFLAFFFCSIYIGANYLHDHLQVGSDTLVCAKPFIITSSRFQKVSHANLTALLIRMKSGGIR
jgi:hypothetical protein